MNEKVSPIFVIGSPRSGTSILTWCLGQHPSVFATEESNWIANFSVNAAVAHAVGSSRRERSQLSACGINLSKFLCVFGESIGELIINSIDRSIEIANQTSMLNPELENDNIKITRNLSIKKTHWIDGTPEYTLQVADILAIFPRAKFIHLIRDVGAVVKSLMRLRNESNRSIVKTYDEAYDYWYRCVKAGINAEEAWGSGVVKRVFFHDLIENKKAIIQEILNFLELKSSKNIIRDCVNAYKVRLNSSFVPVDAETHYENDDLDTKWRTIHAFSEKLLFDPVIVYARDEEKINRQIEDFNKRIDFNKTLDAEYQLAQVLYAKLQAEFNERTEWAQKLDTEVLQCRQTISVLQSELDSRTAWALSQNADIAARDEVIRSLQAELQDRTNWALKLSGELGDAKRMSAELTQKLNDHSGL